MNRRCAIVLAFLLTFVPQCLPANDGPTVAVCYYGDWVTATVQQQAEASVSILTGKKPAHVWLDGKELAPDRWTYSAETGMTGFRLPPGTHELEVAFDADAALPPDSAEIPVLFGERRLGTIRAAFGRAKMFGSLTTNVGPGRYEITADCTPRASKSVTVTIAAGGSVVFNKVVSAGKQPVRLSAEAILGPAPAIEISVADGRVCRNHVKSIALKRLRGPIILDRERPSPEQMKAAVIIEGEDFSAEGGGKVIISRGEHTGTHGVGNIYSWGDAGHWIEWKLRAPEDGDYALYAVIASQELSAVRSLKIDGKFPAPAYELIQFAGTGGWGRKDASQWQSFRITDPGKGLPLLKLSAGSHVLRMKNLFGQHMNVDYFVLVKSVAK